VVEVNMGDDHVVHRIARDAEHLQRPQQPRQRILGAVVDEGGAAVLDDQVGGVEARAQEAGVDRVDAVTERLQPGGKGGQAHTAF
jgi:hypothetical protein